MLALVVPRLPLHGEFETPESRCTSDSMFKGKAYGCACSVMCVGVRIMLCVTCQSHNEPPHMPPYSIGGADLAPRRLLGVPRRPGPRSTLRRGPALGGACLTIKLLCTDLCQTHGFVGLPTRSSVHAAKALRSPMELAMAHRTTKPDSQKRDVVHFEVKNSAAHGDVEHERRPR